jgi:hypothetical protein
MAALPSAHGRVAKRARIAADVRGELGIRHSEVRDAAQGARACVLALEGQDLEYLPAHRTELCYEGRHILILVVAVDHSVELEHCAKLVAECRRLAYVGGVVAVTTANEIVQVVVG